MPIIKDALKVYIRMQWVSVEGQVRAAWLALSEWSSLLAGGGVIARVMWRGLAD